MVDAPKISVILSTFNPKGLELRRSVQSIIDQSYALWELLIYDDGSDSEGQEIIKQVTKLDKRIRYLKRDSNRGIAVGLNECINASKGEYIARMDDDDICLPGRFERQLEFLQMHDDYQWVGVLADLFDESGVWGRADRPENPEPKDFFHSSPFIHPSVMFRRDVLVATGGYSVSRIISRCEDYELFMRLYAQGYKGYNLQEVLFQYQEEAMVLRRSWKYCYYEALIRLHGFNQLGILSIKTFPYVLKPLAVRTLALVPRLAQKVRVKRNKGDHIVA